MCLGDHRGWFCVAMAFSQGTALRVHVTNTWCLFPDENFRLENVQVNGPIPKVNDPIPNS